MAQAESTGIFSEMKPCRVVSKNDGVAGRGEKLRGAFSCLTKPESPQLLMIIILMTMIEGSGLLIQVSQFDFDRKVSLEKQQRVGSFVSWQ